MSQVSPTGEELIMRESQPAEGREIQDRGSAMIMVLAFTIIAALIVVPMLTYAMTVLRVNSVSVEKREELESVRGGARVAIADPVALFQTCTSQTSFATLPTPAVDSTTQCRQISEIGVTDELTIPYSAVALQPGEIISSQPFAGLSHLEPPAAAAQNWWYSTPYDSEPVASSIWLPNLPERDSSVQSSTGHVLPSPYNCRVFFPGTYTDPIVLDDPVYFASGNYYFEEPVTILGGADVVAGFGLEPGCASDLEAFSDIDPADAPQRFNIDGLGATFILGSDARLIVDDSVTLDATDSVVANTADLPARFRINQRYVQNEADGGARVSIATVNGDTDPVDALDPFGPSFVQDLDVPGAIFVPESEVQIAAGDVSTTEFASDRGLVPSTHTAEPTVPRPPVITNIHPLGEPRAHDNRSGAAFIEWAAPTGGASGGSTITQYEVFDQNGTSKCITDGALHCTVIDLPEMNANQTTTFTLVATNALGASDPSAPFSVTVETDDDRLAAPQAPTNVVVDQAATDTTYAPDQQPASVSWDAPTQWPAGPQGPDNDPWFSPPVTQYDVQVYRVYEDHLGATVTEPTPLPETCSTTSFRDQPAPTTCLVYNLPPLDTTPGSGPETVPEVPEVPAIPAVPPATVGTPAIPAIPAQYGTWVGYTFTVTATIPVTQTHVTTSPLMVSEASAASNTIAVFDGTGTAVPAGPNVVPVAPPYVPDPVVDIRLTNSASSEVLVAGYTSIPQGRLHITNPNGGSAIINGGIVAGTYDIDPTTFGSSTIVGFQNTVLQRTVQVITTLPGSNRSSTMTLQINANGADVAVNSWVTQ